MNTNICHSIVNYESDELYQPIKVNGRWIDQGGQQIRKSYKFKINCPCKQYLNENCDAKYKSKLIYETTNHTYFVNTHIKSKAHQSWLEHKNKQTSSLEEKSTNELVERVEELERIIRKEKADFRGYLEIKDKKHQEELCQLEETLKLKDEIIKALKSKGNENIQVANLIDI